MKVLILGASGIVGQTMRLCVPYGIEPVWVRRTPDPITLGYDIADGQTLENLLNARNPDVIVNLAGESSVDTVERDPQKYNRINVGVPLQLADWCARKDKRLIQISSQAVFSGNEAPYSPLDPRQPVNEYGRQKMQAEDYVLGRGQQVIRLTFILGIRPLPHVGRQNPLEAMIAGQSPQVANRWFSPLMAHDAGVMIWREIQTPHCGQIEHFGIPKQWSRYEIARLVNPSAEYCSHKSFVGIAPRPYDTTWSGSYPNYSLISGIQRALADADNDRAVELALFFGMPYEQAKARLAQGFGPLHNAVSDEWRKVAPQTEADILGFYRTTEAYIWELSAYHEDKGFNYSGMCGGIATRLKNEPDCNRVLCLGDGIGDLTLTLHRAGFDAFYHDLMFSRTMEYALFRFWRQTGELLPVNPTDSFDPKYVPDPRIEFGKTEKLYDAVVSLDYLEHVPNVEEWVRAIHVALRPGGLFCAQNAFACGSGPDGAIPMHLSCNDHWEKDWDSFLAEVGFVQLASNWYQKSSPD